MPAKILAHIFHRVEMTKSENAVLRAILEFTNRRGECGEVSHVTLAIRSGYCVRQVYYAIEGLEAQHLLRVQRAKLAWNWNAPNIYTVVLPWLREFTWRFQKDILHKRAHATPLHGRGTQRETSPRACENAPKMTPELCLWLGLTEGSDAYRASLEGLQPQESSHEQKICLSSG